MKKIFLTLTLVLFIIPIGISQDLPSYVPTDGLVAYYPFNGNANDESGNGKNGTVDGANLTSGRFDNETSSYSFDGEDDWIDFIEHPNLKIKNSLTYSAWINIEGMTNFMGIIGTGEGTVLTKTSSMLMVNTDYNLVFEIGNGSERKTITDVEKILDQNNWYHVVGTFNSDDGFIKLYLDGLLVESLDTNISSLLTDIPDSDNRFKIGVRDLYNSGYTYGYFKGKIDDVGIWNRALTEQEIQNLHTSSTGDILLNGTVSAENNQIKNVADPTHNQDAVTLGLLLEKISNLQDQIDEPVYTIGHWPELGGYVFMVSDDGKHGLVAETEDQGFESWYNAQNLISNPSNHSANGQNFTDWRLPTRYELAQMYSQKSEIESAEGDSFGTKTYWTSNQSVYSVNGLEEETAWRQNFGTGLQYNSNNVSLDSDLFVRSVREF